MNSQQDTLSIDPASIDTAQVHAYLLGAVAPRPIAFASTIDKAGNVNLSPFSFFNCFGSKPPTLVFAPARRVRNNTTKHTLENVLEVPEVVINIVNYDIVEQMSLASTEYDRGINEFIKSGLTPRTSSQVEPPRVAEAPAAFECKVKQVVHLGEEGGAGSLIICEVVHMHIKKSILDEKGKIDPHKLDAVARMGGDFYCRASGDALFEVSKPLSRLGIGVDQVPEHIRLSKVLTGNDLGKLANVEFLPDEEAVETFARDLSLRERFSRLNKEDMLHQQHMLALEFLKENKVENAWKVLLYNREVE